VNRCISDIGVAKKYDATVAVVKEDLMRRSSAVSSGSSWPALNVPTPYAAFEAPRTEQNRVATIRFAAGI
jgi:hypothetical protein